MDVDWLPFNDAMASRPFPIDRQVDLAHRDRSVMCIELQMIAVPEPHDGVVGSAKLTSTFDDRLQYRSDIGRRRRNHTQNVAAAGLVGEGFREIVGALAQLA